MMPIEITGADMSAYADEVGDALDEVIGALEITGAASNPHHRRALHKAKQAKQAHVPLAQALRRSREPQVREKASSMSELPFPLGSASIAKTATGNTNNTAQGTFRVERLVIDEASATPAPWLLQVDDILLGNISQNLSAGSQLATFYGPTTFNTPFKGGTIEGGLNARVNFTNLDTANTRVAYASLFGNVIR